MNDSISIALQDTEATNTLLRLCALLGLRGYDARAVPEESALPLCVLREEVDHILLQSTTETITFTKPCRLHSLRGGIERIVAHAAQHLEATMWLCDGLRLDIGRRQLCTSLGENLCDLTEKETALLAHLHRAGEAGVDREALLAELWGYHPDAETRTVDSHIYRLRQKLAELPTLEGIEIAAQQGRYMLVATNKNPHE
jgi:DNA-binding response OmpR family regulator